MRSFYGELRGQEKRKKLVENHSTFGSDQCARFNTVFENVPQKVSISF